MEQDDWRDRFMAILKEKDLDMKEVSLRAGKGETFVRDMLKRGRSPSIDNIAAACSAIGAKLSDVFGEHGEAILQLTCPSVLSLGREDYSAIARYDAALSAGPGSIIDPNAEPLGYHLIERQWLRIATMAAPEQLAILRVDGESMMPTLSDGDWVLIDRTQRSFAREGIYAIQVMDQAWVKRLSLNLREKLIRIISDNPVVPMQEETEENLAIIGKVVALMARRVP